MRKIYLKILTIILSTIFTVDDTNTEALEEEDEMLYMISERVRGKSKE